MCKVKDVVKMFDIVSLGEALIDFTPAGKSDTGMRLFEQNAGGAVTNMLAAASRLGKRTAFIGKVGRDMHGEFLRSALESSGIDTQGIVVTDDYFTTLAFVSLFENGERDFAFARKPGADLMMTPEEIPDGLIENSRIFHTGSLSTTDDPCRAATFAALKRASKAGVVISYDPNYREPLWQSKECAVHGMRAITPYADIMKLSDNECELLTDKADVYDAACVLRSQGVKIVAITLGEQGSIVCTKDGIREIPAFTGIPVLDTTGAGDAFTGGFVSAFLECHTAPADITLEQAVRCALTGNAVAAICVQKRGGIPAMPPRESVSALLESHGFRGLKF